MLTIDTSPNISRNKLIQDAKKINASKFISRKKEITDKEIQLKELYEKFRIALQGGNYEKIGKARANLLTFKALK